MKTNKYLRWLPVLVWALVIFILSSQSTLPGATTVWWDFILKKSSHIFLYGVLCFLAILAAQPSTKKQYLYIIGGCFLYAISDEIHQSFTPGRHPKVMDIGFDGIGVSIAYLKSIGWV